MYEIALNETPIKIRAKYVDAHAMKEIFNLSTLPFVFHHLAFMPDVHGGKGMPIGGVLATKGVVIPNAVGVDIGCGMCAVKTSLKVAGIPSEVLRKQILHGIRKQIPLGFDHHKEAQDEACMPQGFDIDKMTVVKRQFSNINPDIDMDFLPMQSDEAHAYWDEMNYCIEFALCNRRLMMERICQTIGEVYPDAQFEPMINIAHNYAVWENHFDENCIVHRKGATRARVGEIGIIPGSQGTKSYIVEGLGNTDSFQSCSHGAGRAMSRTEAVRSLSLEDEVAKLEAQGIVHAIRGKKDLEEAAGAYKDIDEVMANQTDLVKIVTELSPVAVIKG